MIIFRLSIEFDEFEQEFICQNRDGFHDFTTPKFYDENQKTAPHYIF